MFESNPLEEYLERVLSKVIKQELEIFIQNSSTNNIIKSEDELLTVIEVLGLLKISKPTLFKKMKDGTIPYTRIGRRLLFKKSEVINSLKRRN